MNLNKVENYAQALFEIFNDQKLNEAIYSFVKEFNFAITENIGFVKYYGNFSINKEERKQSLKKFWAKTKIDDLFLNFLFILIDANHFAYLPSILNFYIKLYNKEAEITTAEVYSIDLLKETHIKKLEKSISNKLNKKVYVENKIDKTLIGGYKVIVDNQVWDNSLSSKLVKLSEKIISEKGLKHEW